VTAGGVLAGAAYGVLGLPGVDLTGKADARREVLRQEFHMGPPDLPRGARSGLTAGANGLQVGAAGDGGHYLSPAIKADFPFNYAGLFWSGSDLGGASTAFWMRTSQDGRVWSDWEPVQVEMEPGPLAEYDTYGSLVWADRARYVQFLGELRGSGEAATLERVGLVVLNPYDGPVLDEASGAGVGGFAPAASAAEADAGLDAVAAPALGAPKPITFRREQWGADERLRFDGATEIWPRAYVSAKKLVVHHSATTNGYGTVEDAKAQVRAVYTYHARSLGWGDIGYNWLIDKFGNSYEGRRGRDGPGFDGPGGREVASSDVVAGHALAYNYGSSGIALLGSFCAPGECAGTAPGAAMLSRLRDVLAWECQQHGINPQADSDFLFYDGTWHRNLLNLVGHRDVFQTSCPGWNAYTLLPQLRRDVAARLANPSAPTVTIVSAPAEGDLLTGIANYSWRGSGGSGGLQYSYCLQGWSRIASDGDANYYRGYTSKKTPAWSPWTTATSARLYFAHAGRYSFHIRVRDSAGRISVYQDSRSFSGGTPSRIADGALIRDAGPAVYVVRGGLKRHIPNPVTFETERFLWGDVNFVSSSVLGSIATGQRLLDALANGNLLRGSGPEVYVMEGGAKRHVINPTVLADCGYGWDAVRIIPNPLLNAIPTGSPLSGAPGPLLVPPSGAIVRAGGPEVYFMSGGLKRHIPNIATFEAFRLLWGNVNFIADSALSTIPTGDALLDALADGNLLRGTGPEVYAMEGAAKRHVTSPTVLTGCGYGWDAVRVIANASLNAIATGSPLSGPPCPHVLPADGSLVKGSGPEVYLMEGGLKCHIPDLATFANMGLLWGNLNNIPDSVLNSILTGEPLPIV
jgi:hypothetical protein